MNTCADTCVAIRHVAFEDVELLSGLLAERDALLRYLEAGVDPIGAPRPAAPSLARG